MPTYEYRCTSCGNVVEVFQRIGEDSLTVCGICGGPLRKVFHPAGIVFKGSGFYATDSRSGSRDKGKASGDGKSGEGTSKKSEKAGSEKGRAEKGSGSSSESKEKSS